MSEKNEWKIVPVEPTDDMIDSGCKQHKCEQGDSWYTAFDLSEGDCRLIYAAMLDAAPAPAPSAPGDAQDERIALDRLADYIADNWPDKKYTLEEICQRLNGTWPGAFMPAAPAAGDALELLRLRRIAWLIGRIFVHGDFKAETFNERELENLLRENGTFWDSLPQFDAALAAQVPQQGEA